MTNDEHTQTTARNVRAACGLLTEDEMAAVLLLSSTATLAAWRSQGKGPPSLKLGKRVFYTMKDFGEWAAGEGRAQLAAANDNKPAQVAA